MILTTQARAQGPHALSPSQVTTFLDCSYRWYCSHALQLPDAPNGGLCLGRALHSSIAAALRYKMADQDGHTTPPIQLHEHLRRGLAAELDAGHLAPDEDRTKIEDTAHKMLDVWTAQVAPSIQPASVETKLTGEIAGVQIHAIADVVERDGTVTDFKSAAKKPGQLSADHAFQLTTYAMLSHSTKARRITITKTATPAIVQHTHLIQPSDIRYAETIYPQAAQAMQDGLYLPRRSSNLCSRKHCAFWRQCESEFGGSVRD